MGLECNKFFCLVGDSGGKSCYVLSIPSDLRCYLGKWLLECMGKALLMGEYLTDSANGGISDRFGEFVAECFPMHSVTIITESQNTDYVSRNSSKKLSKTNRILETVSNAFPFRHC
jgi:hypothetical protein